MKHVKHTAAKTAPASAHTPSSSTAHGAGHGHYRRLFLMIALSYLAMFALMYAMVDVFGNVLLSVNQVYMAGLMTAPMVMLELALMGSMYPNKRLNAVVWTLAIIALVGFWALIRAQTLVDDRQFLRSMIPHHAGAILMCEQASVRDPKIVALCENILASQSKEIALMKSWLDEPVD